MGITDSKQSNSGIMASKQSITDETNSHNIVLYVSNSCPYCTSAIRDLKAAGKTIHVVEASSAQRSVSVKFNFLGFIYLYSLRNRSVFQWNDLLVPIIFIQK
jgi:glutaredoxin